MEPRSQESDIDDPKAALVQISRGVDDPFARFVERWWREVVTVAVVCAAVFFGYRSFDETQLSRQREAADLFAKVGDMYRGVAVAARELHTAKTDATVTKTDAERDAKSKKLADATKSFDERVSKLDQAIAALRDSRAPYGKLADLYAALRHQLGGDGEKAIASVSSLKSDKSVDPMVRELASFVEAKLLLDSKDGAANALSALQSIALEGGVASVAAALSVAHLANDPQSRAKAVELLSQIQAKFPEQGDLVRNELQRLQGK